MKDRNLRLQKWIQTLTESKKDELLLLCVKELIDSELFNFWENSKVPTWDATGENIDGTERE